MLCLCPPGDAIKLKLSNLNKKKMTPLSNHLFVEKNRWRFNFISCVMFCIYSFWLQKRRKCIFNQTFTYLCFLSVEQTRSNYKQTCIAGALLALPGKRSILREALDEVSPIFFLLPCLASRALSKMPRSPRLAHKALTNCCQNVETETLRRKCALISLKRLRYGRNNNNNELY